jgi:sirohydrochlorin ferrochelatase
MSAPGAPVLLAVAHGSRDPAALATVTSLARQVSRLAPGVDVRMAFLQHAEPALGPALRAAGRSVVMVPLLLSAGYHLTADITAAAARTAGARVAAPLGPDPLLTSVLAARLTECGTPAGTPVVLAAAGSSDPAAGAAAQQQAQLLAGQLGVPVLAAYASAGRPSVDEALAVLRARHGRPAAVAAYLLSPGQFHDQLRQKAAAWVTAPLGAHPAVACLAVARYLAAGQPGTREPGTTSPGLNHVRGGR